MNEAPHERAGADPPARWWDGPGGGREVLAVASPLVVSSLSWTVMTFVDRVMLRHDSGDAMAAAFIAGCAWFTALCLPMGVCLYTATFVAQHHGAGQPRRIGPCVWQGVWMALVASPLVMLLIPAADTLFAFTEHTPTAQDLEARYFRVLCWGGPAMLLAQPLSAFYSGRGLTMVVMAVDATFAVLNVVLDYCWIFGHFGFPAAGIDGAAWATVVSMWLKAGAYALLVVGSHARREFATDRWRPDFALLGRMLRYGLPSGLQMEVEVLGFTAFIVLVARLGPVEAEATSMAFSVSTLAFMPVWGLGQAASILVGQHLGENRDSAAARATWTTLWVALAYMSVVSALYVLTPGLFLSGFFSPVEVGENDAAVRAAAAVLLAFVAAYNLLDATNLVFVHALKGAGDTRFVLLANAAAAAAMTAAAWLAVERFDAGLYGCWTLIVLWVWTLGAAYCLRFLGGKWRSMRVIETDPPAREDGAEPIASVETPSSSVGPAT